MTDEMSFSALQRAENSSMLAAVGIELAYLSRFSALQRAENSSMPSVGTGVSIDIGFSALQRAENSSILKSRKVSAVGALSFSALQRAENSSIWQYSMCCARHPASAFQCSSASRKFLNAPSFEPSPGTTDVSVLFSEPKIPQCWRRSCICRSKKRFSALQRAENSSIVVQPSRPAPCALRFQCSSASRKFLNSFWEAWGSLDLRGFSALQRAENSSICSIPQRSAVVKSFSALQRAENSSIRLRFRRSAL